MSILLIGQRNRYYSSQKPKFLEYQQAEDYKRTKKNVQDQYRRELIEQMNDTYERKRKQRERQKIIDLKYEQVFYDQLADYQHRIQTENLTNPYSHKRNQTEPAITYNSPKPYRKQHQLTLPMVNNQFNLKRSKIARLETQPISTSFHTKPIQRLNTDFHKYDEKYNQRYEQKWQSAEVRQKKLHDELQSKLKEVYQLMAHSVKQFNESQQLQKIGAKLQPIRLNIQKQYKMKYPQPVNPQFNVQIKPDYYKLPNINQDYRQRTPSYEQQQTNRPVYQSEREWREWYAKQKLRELESRYKKELDLQASQVRLFNRRVATPKFKTQMNEN